MPAARAAGLAGGLLIACWPPDAAAGGRAATGHRAGLRRLRRSQVIHQRRTVTREPAACRGLSQQQVEQAVGQAIRLAEGGHHKAVSRELAVAAGARLAYLITAAPPAPRPRPRRAAGAAAPGRLPPGAPPGPRSPQPSPRWSAGSSPRAPVAYLLAGWISHGGARRPRTRSAGLPPAVIFGHFGLAVTGLLIWAAFVATAVTALAWTAAGLLMPVAGLGFATLALLISAQTGRRAHRPRRPSGSARRPGSGAGHRGPRRAAALTILLVVLAALAP